MNFLMSPSFFNFLLSEVESSNPDWKQPFHLTYLGRPVVIVSPSTEHACADYRSHIGSCSVCGKEVK